MSKFFSVAIILTFSLNLHAEFKDLSQAEKDAALKNYSTWQNLSADQKQKLEKNWDSYQKMSPDQRAKLAEKGERIRALSPARKTWLKRKTFGHEERPSHRRKRHQSRAKIRRNTA